MLVEDEDVKENIINPMKKRAYPIFFGSVFFNILITIILIIILIKLNQLGALLK